MVRLLPLLLVAVALGCGKQKAVDRVEVNAVKKSFFEDSSWYFSRTVIDVDYEGGAIGTFPGDAAMDFQGSDLASIPRIRWVIDEDALYAYRDYELLEGGNPGSPEPGSIISHPVAAFEVEKHFDIQRAYNPATGEQQNVIVENDTDRPWYEREFMRVNWAKNLLPGYYGQTSDLYDIVGLFTRQPADLFVQAESEFPDSWQPRFHFMGCDGLTDESETCSEHELPWAFDYEKDQLYAFDFVTQELLAPDDVPDPFTGAPVNFCVSAYLDAPTCTTTAVYVRNGFLRVSDTRQYQPVNWLDTRFEDAGYFRLERRTIDRSTAPDDPAYFETDFLNYNINRHNLWYEWWDADGNPVPFADRQVRPLIYYTTPELPAHLVEPSFEVMARWNEVFMLTVRELQGQPAAEYPDVPCQDDNPDAYCACIRDPDGGDVLNPTCSGQYDPFEAPEAAAARGVTNPYACWVDVPGGARPNLNKPDLSDSDFSGWFAAAQAGDECVIQLRINDCNKATLAENGGMEGLACQERGDARFKYLSYVDQPGTGFLGIATLRGDPVTGELIIGDANIGGPALDGYRTTALQMYDLINGDLTDQEFLSGEDVRTYLQNLDRIQLPARPRVDFNVAMEKGTALPIDRQAVDNRMAAFAARAVDLQGPAGRANTFIERRAALRGSDIERRLMESYETLAQAGIAWIPDGYGPADITDDILDRVSPFRAPVHEQLGRALSVENAMSGRNIMMPNEYVDNSVLFFVNAHQDWPRARLEIALNRLLYFQTQLHEMGHCLGLRHDFGGSVDTENYDDEYYQIANRVPLPDPGDFDVDAEEGLSADEQVAFEIALDDARERRELAGIDKHMNSSVMEYTAQWYERIDSRAGRYDIAAVAMGYGDLIELYDNQDGRLATEIDPTTTGRAWAKYYHGGELCEVNSDCPFGEGGSRAAELNDVNRGAGLTQQCEPHPQGQSTHGSLCSNFDADAEALVDADPRASFVPVDYRFCSEERVGSLGWCNRFDEGENYREIIRNVAEQYEREYIFTHFRRYQSDFDINSAASRLVQRHFTILQDVFQNLLFRYQTDAEYRTDAGPFGFYDQFMATADTLNFYARILGQPDVGSYAENPSTGNFERVNPAFAELNLSLGLGRYFSSTYQRGLTGIFRIERVGQFYDKWLAMQMLTFRGWTVNYTRDTVFWTNFYDLFPVEMQQIFQGLIQDEPEAISPRLACLGGDDPCIDPRIVYMDFYRGDCSTPETCRPDPVEETYADLDIIDGGSSVFLQYLAALFSLAEFPIYYDTTYQNQLFICVDGEGDCFEPPDGAVEGEDFVRYESARYGKAFLAWRVEPVEAVPNQESIGFNMVTEAANNAFAIGVLQDFIGDGDPIPPEFEELGYRVPVTEEEAEIDLVTLDRRQRNLESFFFQLIDLQRQLGIGDIIVWAR